jgi:hypothetical protein
MENDAQRTVLSAAELPKLVNDSVEYLRGHSAGLRLPAIIPKVVDVAVAAVEVAATGRLDQDGIDFPGQSGDP